MKKKLLFLACISMLASAAQASDGNTVKSLMLIALNSPDGTAKGIVEGAVADKIHATTGAYDPVRAEVTTIKRYKEAGCSRLAVKLIQPNTPTKEGPKTDFALNYELDMCKNGQPPNGVSAR
jgi:hypothetical protein